MTSLVLTDRHLSMDMHVLLLTSRAVLGLRLSLVRSAKRHALSLLRSSPRRPSPIETDAAATPAASVERRVKAGINFILKGVLWTENVKTEAVRNEEV